MLFGERITLYFEDHTEQTNTFCWQNVEFVAQRKYYVSAIRPNRLKLFSETVAVYCENHTEHTDSLCRQNVEIVPYRKHICSLLESPTA
jgi:hypothetical protein